MSLFMNVSKFLMIPQIGAALLFISIIGWVYSLGQKNKLGVYIFGAIALFIPLLLFLFIGIHIGSE